MFYELFVVALVERKAPTNHVISFQAYVLPSSAASIIKTCSRKYQHEVCTYRKMHKVDNLNTAPAAYQGCSWF